MGRVARRLTTLAAALALAVLPAEGQQTGSPAEVRLEPAPQVRTLAEAGEPLTPEQFLQTALLFSAASPADNAAARQTLTAHVAALRLAVGGSAEPRSLAERALSYMHEAILGRYEEKQTRLDELLRGGGFNCVSSGVLYAALVKSLGLQVWGVRTVDHAFCRVQAGPEAYDVETTSPFGFEPGRRTEFTDSFGKVTGYTYVPPSNYRDRRDIGERELLALILYNRTAFLTERRAYAEAVPPAVDAHALLGDAESRQRLVTTVHNLASSLAAGRRFEEATQLLTRVGALYPELPLGGLPQDILHNRVLGLLQGGRLDDAEALLDARRGSKELEDGQWRSLTVYLYQLRAQEASRRDLAEAAQLARTGLDKVGADAALLRSYEVYVHNQIVSLAQARRFEEALSALREALERAPASAILTQDRNSLETQLGR